MVIVAGRNHVHGSVKPSPDRLRLNEHATLEMGYLKASTRTLERLTRPPPKNMTVIEMCSRS